MFPSSAGTSDGATGRPTGDAAGGTASAIVLLLLAALAARLTIAYVLFPGSGFGSDVGTYQAWANGMVDLGPGGFYAGIGFADYPPAYLYVLWGVGALARAIPSLDLFSLVKLPAQLADIAVGYLLYRLVLGWCRPGRRAGTLALIAAAAYLFNPVTIYDSAVWGQTDAIGGLVILLGVAALVRGNSEGGAALAVLAALVKPQFGIVLIPVAAAVILSRHLLRPGSGPRSSPWGPAVLRQWLAAHQGPSRLLTSAIAGAIVFFTLALPFGLGPLEFIALVEKAAGGYAGVSVNAYNPWALVGTEGYAGLAFQWWWSNDQAPLLGPLTPLMIGTALLVAGYLYGFLRALLSPDRWTVILAATWLAFAFFILPTRVHERYLFPVFALLPLLAVVRTRWAIALVLVAIGAFINLHGVLMLPGYATEVIAGWPLGQELGPGRPLPVILALTFQTAGAALAAWELRRRLEPDPYELVAGEIERATEVSRIPEHARPVGLPGAEGTPGATAAGRAAMGGTGPRTVGEGTGRTVAGRALPPALAGIAADLSRVLTQPRIRADRSAGLAREQGGRVGPRDLALVAAFVVVAVVLRGIGLAQPYRMYFDEVYHARTALEFLQDWRYGDPHSIYEYTHPHLAKYAMAASVEIAGGNVVTGSGTTGLAAATDALTERRRIDDETDGRRLGDRLWVAGPEAIVALDLADRHEVARLPFGAVALALDGDAHLLYAAGADGEVRVLDTTALDPMDDPSRTPELRPILTLPAGAPVTGLAAAGDALVALRADGSLVAIDPFGGAVLAEARVAGGVAIAALPDAQLVIARPAELGDAGAAADRLAGPLLLEPTEVLERLNGAVGAPTVVLAGYPDEGTTSELQGLIDAGSVTGVTVESGPVVGIAGAAGAAILDARSLREIRTLDIGGPALGIGLGPRDVDDADLYVTGARTARSFRIDTGGPVSRGTIELPGDGGEVIANDTAGLVHIVGTTAAGDPTVYVVEPRGDSLFADARLPFAPVTVVPDFQPRLPSADRTALIAIGADGATATIGAGGNAFAWRLPGVLAGALTLGLLVLLCRILFRRRTVALAVGALGLAEGMLFANARIAMNDVYVTLFVVAAATVFAWLWAGGSRRAWQVVAGLVLTGLLLGLALASKWVAMYAVGGLALLVLLRSGLGRLLALAGMIGLTAVLGAAALRAPDVPDPGRNWLFPIIMLLLTMALAAAIVRRPVRISTDELRFATFAPAVVGILALLAAGAAFLAPPPPADVEPGLLSAGRLLVVGVAALVAAAAVPIVARIAARSGYGPLATTSRPGPVPAAPPTESWLRPGARLGLPWLFALGCIGVIPIVVYVLSYLPWAGLGNQLWPGFPAGNSGQTLWELTRSMYDYHDGLRATHAASSPWWAWPLDLKPVWFYLDSFAGGLTGTIYDTGNLVIFWMGIAAMGFAAWAAWVRRSLPLTLIVILFLAMWIPWSRIDRATFQYHVYASLPFTVLALGYLVAELWHGPSRVAWALARAAAALVIVGAPLLWILRIPVCLIAGVDRANGGLACSERLSQTVDVNASLLGGAIVLLGGLAIAFAILRIADQQAADGEPRIRSPWLPMAIVGGMTALGIVAMRVLAGDATLTVALEDLLVAIPAVVLCSLVAWVVLRARDPRRFAAGIVLGAAVFFVLYYPNLSGLPVPSGLSQLPQKLLPTWIYDFQFFVNTDPRVEGGLIRIDSVVMGVTALFAAGVAITLARSWRAGRERSAG